MDTITKEKRSIVMSNIKSKNTSIEVTVRKILHKQGYRYKLHDSIIFGKPDLYLPKYNTAVFINGCFWHCHKMCRFASTPKSNQEYWNKKLGNNQIRDEKVHTQLTDQKIKIIIIWECTIKKLKNEDEINNFLNHFKSALESDELILEI